jgi:mRNA deadenylase 3'-5' endonuclease subunit Ccr4
MSSRTHRVVSYNLLSSNLAAESHFVTCTKNQLASRLRGPRLLAKLDAEIAAQPTLLCLQELSQTWGSDLHTHLANKGYHLVTAFYGQRHNGHMGVAIAFPTEHYELKSTVIRTIAETRDLYKAPEPTLVARVVAAVALVFAWFASFVVARKHAARDPYEYAMARENVVVAVQLACKHSQKTFWVATYHMPCAFMYPQMMTVHSSLVLQFVAKQAGAQPFVLAGDFNWSPKHEQYQLYTAGTLAESSAARPPPPGPIAQNWSIDVPPVRSAYAECGGEPAFTNWAQIKSEPVFKETLDYIWLSKHWRVDDVLRHQPTVGPLPTESDPSDHLLIAATLALTEHAKREANDDKKSGGGGRKKRD